MRERPPRARRLAGAPSRLAAAGALAAMLAVLTAPVAAQEAECVEVPGVNEACPVWATDYDSPADGCTEEAAHQVTGPDAVYQAATRICGSSFDILVVAFGLDGTRRWAQAYAGPAGGRDHPFGLAVSPDGRRLFVAGSEDTGEDTDWVTIALDAATGEREWVANHAGPAADDDEAWLVAASEDGERVYVAGFDRTAATAAGLNVVTIAYDASTGERAWIARFDGDPQRIDFPRAIGVSGDRVVVTGSSLGAPPSQQDLQTVAYRDDRELGRAEELWRATYDGGDWDQPLAPCLTRTISFCLGLMGSVAVTGDTVAVAATSFNNPTTDDAVWSTVAYDLGSGERRWVRTFGDPTLQSKANAVAASPDGETIYVTGFTNDELLWDGVGDSATVAYDAETGQQRWQASYALPAVDDAAGFSLATDGETVYVGGSVQLWPADNARVDVLTLAYDADAGTQDWVARYNRSASTPVGVGDHDSGHWIGLSPDGRRLVVGGGFARNFRLQDSGDYWDLGLLAYDV
ncbi:MAG TPA: PQQ-binding-like beta-propeller repeat protein [Actinomycetota bacterium]